jgi:rubredoxin
MASYKTTSNPSAVQAWDNLARNWVFACPLCGRMGIVITERLFWYSCRHCGYELASMKPQEMVRNEVVSRGGGLVQVQV